MRTLALLTLLAASSAVAATDADRTAQQVALQTRAAWLGLTVGAARTAALGAASKKANHSR